MVIVGVPAALRRPFDVTRVQKDLTVCTDKGEERKGEENRGRGSIWGRDEQDVPGHAVMGTGPLTLETFAGLNGALGLARVLQAQPLLEQSPRACAGAFCRRKTVLAPWGWRGCGYW